MITHISIKDFAVIEDAQIEFREGLNILTGETGAGKSVVIEAISLALGARADASFVRTSKDKAVIQMVAELDEGEYIISREISTTGKNICKINGEIVPLSYVKSLCARIADIHGQYDHQSLLNPDNHIQLIDSYGKKDILPLKEQISSVYEKYTKVSSRLNSLIKGEKERQRKHDFLVFELDEIRSANLLEDEDIILGERIKYLENCEKIYENLSNAYEICIQSNPLGDVKSYIEDLSEYSKELSSMSEEINDIYYRLEDLTRQLRVERDSSTYSEEELNESITRLELIDNLKRKYGNTIEDILKYAANIEEEISITENSDELKSELEKEKDELKSKLDSLCSELTALRKKASDELKESISKELLELNFKDARLDVVFTETDYTKDGKDSVEFLLSTNRGEDLKPLAKVASGGEMSRIMLAFKKTVSDCDGIPTIIFDEIDAGISGITASIVAKKMQQISDSHQVICITHLPQIAASGKYNYRITKDEKDERTFTSIVPLNENEKVQEIARLLGGINITETTVKSAQELIKAASAK